MRPSGRKNGWGTVCGGLFAFLIAASIPLEVVAVVPPFQSDTSIERADDLMASTREGSALTHSLQQGLHLIWQGRPDKAEELARVLLIGTPHDYRGYELLGDARLAMGDLEGALEAYEMAMASTTNLDEVKAKYLQVQSQIYPSRGKQSLLSGAFQLPVGPTRSDLSVVQVGAQTEKSPKESPSPYKQILSQLQLGEVAGLRDKVMEVIHGPGFTEPELEEVQLLTEAVLKLGKALIQEGRPEEAVELASGILWLTPTNVPLNHLLGTAAVAAGDEEEAMFTLQRALHLAPDDKDLLQELRASRQRLGFSDLGAGMEEFEKPSQSKKAEVGHRLRGYALVNYGWDNNISRANESSVPHPTTLGGTIEPEVERDASADLTVSIQHDFSCSPEGWAWINRIRFFLSDYRHYEDEDFLLLGPATGLKYRSGGDSLGLLAFWEPLYSRDRLYRNQRGLELFARHATAGNSVYRFTYRYTHRHHFANRGSALSSHHGRRHYLQGTWRYYGSEHGWWVSRCSYAYSKTPVELNHPTVSHRVRGQVYYHYMLCDQLELYGGVMLWMSRYSNYDRTFTDRRERNYGIAGELGAFWELSDNLALLSSLYQGYNDSNVPTDDYKQGKCSIGLQCSF